MKLKRVQIVVAVQTKLVILGKFNAAQCCKAWWLQQIVQETTSGKVCT